MTDANTMSTEPPKDDKKKKPADDAAKLRQELEELRRQNAELTSLNAELHDKLTSPAPAITTDGPCRLYQVELDGNPTVQVLAPDQGVAVDLYRAFHGILGSEKSIKASLLEAGTPQDRPVHVCDGKICRAQKDPREPVIVAAPHQGK